MQYFVIKITKQKKVNVVGVNNRDLNTMKIDINQSIIMSNLLPKDVIKVSESGIESIETIMKLKSHGYQGFKRFLLGSVAQTIASHAKCSVEIIRQRQDSSGCGA